MRGDGREEGTAGPWLLGIILLALVVWVASMLARADSERADEVALPVQSLASSEALIGWVRDSAAAAHQTLPPRAFVTSALRRMTLALSGLVSHVAPALAPDLQRLDADVSAFIADSAGGTRHARAALGNAIALLDSIHDRVPPVTTAEADAVDQALDRARAAVAAVEPEGVIEEQTLLIDHALRELAEAVHIVARTAGAP